MRKNKERVFGLLIAGILLGSLEGKSFANTNLTVDDGGVHSETINDNYIVLKVDNASTLEGKVTLEEKGFGDLKILNSSIWKGDLATQKSSNGTVTLENSKWEGNIQNLGVLDVHVLKTSQWNGNIETSDGESDLISHVYVRNESSWQGDMNSIANRTDSAFTNYIHINDGSDWKGNLNVMDTRESGTYDLEAFVTASANWTGDAIITSQNDSRIRISMSVDSKWQGNVDISGTRDGGRSHAHVKASESSWEGNASIIGDFYSDIANFSTWEGNFSVAKVGDEDYSNVYIDVRSNSSWIGNAEISAENIVGGDIGVSIGNDSSWKGDLDYTGTMGEKNFTFLVTVSNDSSWEGNSTISVQSASDNNGGIILKNSKWDGNLDHFLLSEGASSYMGMMLDNSAWEGNAKISGNSSIETYLDNSSWKGDLDIRENQVSTEHSTGSAGQLYLENHSQWEGRILNSEQSVDTYLAGNSNWLMTGDSKIASLTAEDSGISFATKSKEFSTLTVEGDFEGSNNLLQMNTDLAANAGDLLVVKGEIIGEANQIAVNNQGSSRVNPVNELTIVTSEGTTDGQFSLVNAVEVGGYEYELKRVNNSWNLYTTSRPTTTATASLNAFVGSYLLNYAETQSLLKRLGDLRSGSLGNEVWARVYGGEFESRGSHFLRGFGMDYTGIQAGFDKKVKQKDERETVYIGGFIGYAKGNLDHGAGSGSIDSKSIGAYWTHLHHNGFYADLVLKYGWMKNDFKALDTTEATIKGSDIKTEGFSGSLEVGRRYHFDQQEKQGWYAEPQVQLTVGHQGGDKFTASNGLQIKVEPLKSILMRTGVNVGYEVKSGKNPINVYVKAAYMHEFEGEIGIYYNGIKGTENLGSNWWIYGVGATVRLGSKHNLYLDVERASGSRFRQPWSVNGGYRFSW